ncbi:MAG: 4Fe-4S binding protein [Syntrophomonadaceae bacterium]|nr:4Fe-4S binding protein [Syntrophomonadaceae bacterium]
MVEMIMHVELCKGCGLCQATCPQDLLSTSDQVNSKGFYPVVLLDKAKCTGCALCARMCPDLVIEIHKQTA